MPLTLGINSYATLEEANAYATDQGLDAISDEAFLVRATKWIERTFGGRFIGAKQVSFQSLSWPRVATARTSEDESGYITLDSDGNPINLNTIPVAVKEATIEVALLIQNGTDLYVQPTPAVVEETTEIDVLKTHKVYAGSYRNANLYKIELILRPVLGVTSLKLVR